MGLIMICHKSCEAEVLFGKKVASIQSIQSKVEGKGHATQCLELIEIIAKKKKVKEIWFPTVISPALEHILQNRGYKFTNFGKHPKMPDAGDVWGYKLNVH